MLDCPQCNAPVDGEVCPKCGYSETGKQGSKKQPPRDPDWWRCANVEMGQRCAKPGAISHGTLGGGPWYCAQHAFPQSKPTAPPRGFQSVRQAMRIREPGEEG